MIPATLLATLLIAAVNASVAQADPQWNASDPEKTEALSLKGDVARGEAAFVICQGCHRIGAQGRADGSYPRLAGQHATVLIKQLVDVRSGRRNNPKMMPFSDHQSLLIQDIADLAAYLQQLPVHASQGQGDGKDAALGRQLYERNCMNCHGAEGLGDAGKFYPRVSGQHYRYLVRAGLMIRDGERRNANPEMVAAIRHYSDDEVAKVADYMSRIPILPH